MSVFIFAIISKNLLTYLCGLNGHPLMSTVTYILACSPLLTKEFCNKAMTCQPDLAKNDIGYVSQNIWCQFFYKKDKKN